VAELHALVEERDRRLAAARPGRSSPAAPAARL